MNRFIRRNKYILLTLLLAAVLSITGCTTMSDIGRQNLYSRAESDGPSLPVQEVVSDSSSEDQEGSEGSSDTEDAKDEDVSADAQQIREWKKGWLRYNGEIMEYNSNCITFLFMGIDKIGKVQPAADGMSGGQADALFLVTLNPDRSTVSIIAVNRNTMTPVEAYNEAGKYVGTYDLQVCLQHGYGDGMQQSCERQVSAVSNLFYQLPIHGYISLNMNGIVALNDAVGGVTLDILQDIPASKTVRALKKGETVTLSGEEAWRYTRYRDHNEFDSASDRLEREKQYLDAFMQKMRTAIKENPSLVMSIYQAISPYMVTNVELADLIYLTEQVSSYRFDENGIRSMEGETILADSGFEEFYPDEQKLYDLMIDVFYQKVQQPE